MFHLFRLTLPTDTAIEFLQKRRDCKMHKRQRRRIEAWRELQLPKNKLFLFSSLQLPSSKMSMGLDHRMGTQLHHQEFSSSLVLVLKNFRPLVLMIVELVKVNVAALAWGRIVQHHARQNRKAKQYLALKKQLAPKENGCHKKNQLPQKNSRHWE